MTDGELLQRLVAGDRAAMEQLVRRHLTVVYGAAVRQVGRASAEDVAQGVFLLLSSRARQVQGERLVGWLLKATFYACRDVKKRERRRRFHEERAMAERERDAREAGAAGEEALWEEIRPVLDGVLMRLGEVERTLVGLRVLEGRSWEEVGAAAGMSEEAARKRVGRALEKLRGLLKKRGVVAPAAGALAGLLLTRGAEAAPAGLAGTIAGGGSAGAGVIAQATGKVMAMAKVKLAAMGGAAVVMFAAVVGTVIAQVERAAPTAAGTVSVVSTTVPAADGSGVLRGVVVDPAGKAVAGADYRVMRFGGGSYVREAEGKTGPDGAIEVKAELDEAPPRVVVVDVPGYAWAWWRPRQDMFERRVEDRVVLERPTVVEGRVTDESGRPVSDASVATTMFNMSAAWSVGEDDGLAAKTDAAGVFRVERVPPSARAQITVRRAGYAAYATSQEFPNADVQGAPIAAGTRDVEVKMGVGGSMRVQVMRDGQPWKREGLPVWAVPVDKGVLTGGKTDREGAVVLEGLRPGQWRIVVDRAAVAEQGVLLAPAAAREVVAGKVTEAVVSTETGRRVSGLLKDEATGKPVRGRVVVAEKAAGMVVASGQADDAGRFAFPAPEGGDYVLKYIGETAVKGKVYETDVASRGHVEGVVLRVGPKPRLRGRLVDVKGKPVAGRVTDAFHFVDTDKDGHFEMDPPGVINGAMIGLALDRKRTLGRGFVYHPGDEAKEWTLVLEPMGAVEGRVTEGGAGSSAGVKLSTEILMVPGEGDMVPPHWVWDVDLHADGKFRIAPVPVGCAFNLLATKEGGYGSVRVEALKGGEVRELGTVEMIANGPPSTGQTGVVEGTVVNEDGKAVVSARVSMMGGLSPEEATSDMKGRFQLKKVPTGREVMVAAYAAGYGPAVWKGEAGATGVVLTILPQGYALWGKPAPELTVSQWVVGGFEKWEELRGKVVVLQTQQDYETYLGQPQDMRQLYAKYKDQGLEVVMIQWSRPNLSVEKVRAWAKDMAITWAIGLDAADESGMGVMALQFDGSANYVIDKKGALRASIASDKLEEWVKKLLAE